MLLAGLMQQFSSSGVSSRRLLIWYPGLFSIRIRSNSTCLSSHLSLFSSLLQFSSRIMSSSLFLSSSWVLVSSRMIHSTSKMLDQGVPPWWFNFF